MSNLEYSDLSVLLTKKLNKKDKKDNGIFFTPPSTVNTSLKLLQKYIPNIKNIKNILEPSCGSCEYLNAIKKVFINCNITGIEFNDTIYESIKELSKDNIKILNQDFLKFSNQIKYDLIIGNPPFYVLTKKNINKIYHPYFNGRANIYILFIIKSLLLLNKNGILSFILPRNFLNCSYYNETREYINKNFTILNIINFDDKYIETKQKTVLLLVQNKPPINNNKFVLIKNNLTIFNIESNILKIKEYFNNSKSLFELGFEVIVGNIVWNQCCSENIKKKIKKKKDNKIIEQIVYYEQLLTNDSSKTRLIYNGDIKNNTLQLIKYKNKKKLNYIEKDGLTEPLLVLNRGYGKGTYKFNYCLIDIEKPYLIENHLICIKSINKLNKKDLINKYKKIINSFENNKTVEFIKLYFTNNAINTTELNYILPIYDI